MPPLFLFSLSWPPGRGLFWFFWGVGNARMIVGRRRLSIDDFAVESNAISSLRSDSFKIKWQLRLNFGENFHAKISP